jgi:hypothetical protein
VPYSDEVITSHRFSSKDAMQLHIYENNRLFPSTINVGTCKGLKPLNLRTVEIALARKRFKRLARSPRAV